MYSVSDVEKVQKETPAAPHQHHIATEEENKERSAPSLAAYLTLLNNLAQHDLNFQNLLVLHNLVSLGLDFGENKRQTDHRFPSWDRRKNCLAELVESFNNKQRTKAGERGYSMSHRPTYDGTKQVLGTFQQLGVVVGYPASELQYSFQRFPNGGTWDPSMQAHGRDDQPYHHGEWASTHWNQWNGGEIVHGGVVGVMEEESGSNTVGQSEASTSADVYGNGEDNQQTCDEGGSLYKCNSWPESIAVLTTEGWVSGVEGSRVENYQSTGGLDIEAPFTLEEELKMDRLSDLERFMEEATPRLQVTDLEKPASMNGSLTMEDIWQFYELPCVYGLQVPFLKGCRSISFAHFVPSLSAIRLFKAASCSTSNDPAHKDIFLCDVPKLPQFMQLVFDFFETMKPHVRRPLFEEVCHLSRVGFSGKCLPNLQLSEIHPSSWFSVAWYPIYCIPEGRLRTSFLTYHSFGPSQTNNIVSASNNAFEASLIGLKFLSLNREAWIRPHAADQPERKESASFYPKPLDENSQHSRTKNGVERPQEAEQGHSLPNGCTAMDGERITSEPSKDLENRIELLLANAEHLSRARYRRVAPGTVESHKCYHSDFEFFHQRS